MTSDDDIVVAIQVHLRAVEILEADLQARARDRARATTASDDEPVYITPKQATAICGRSESQVRRDCELNPIDSGGFGLKGGGRWLVERVRYTEMRGNARFRR
ncbi:hypothetical protein [Bradyrhizobium sp. RP6]|uniref:hypothetical protein n=1 Tax=Bradyrhizobium sp. RP6 TaxID=2489596 RepID=UPI000F530AA3|nr:hypothetical protein [Bradyrhizobium sp. RP6]RQH15688.1 hypothetical protein EHH60_00360 [Bradyrhizobium sp. RP6]